MNSRTMIRRAQAGFTLIELMIVTAIIAILAAIALPQYTQYTKKAKFTEVVALASGYKTDVALCAQNNDNAVASCNGGASGTGWEVKANITNQIGNTASIAVEAGVITATAISGNGLAGETFILTPTTSTGGISWAITGTCTTAPRLC